MKKSPLDYSILKKNAPVIWEMTIGKRIRRLDYEIEALKVEYRREQDPVKRAKIAEEGKALKEERLQYE